MRRVSYLWLEFLAVFGGLPMFIYLTRDRGAMFIILWVGAAAGYYTLKRANPAFTYRSEWHLSAARAGIRPVMERFFLLAIMLTCFAIVHDTDRLFDFPAHYPQKWLLVMLLYPLLSVWPQEILFRSFLMQRYAPIFTKPVQLAAVSAFAFAYAHIVFNNWVAFVFCLAGGWLFAGTYQRHRSLALACLEHSVYGCFVFTLGLGWYFYGAAWQR